MNEKIWLEDTDGRNVDQLIGLEETHRVDSIVVAIEGCLLLKDGLNETERVIVAIEALEREVNNGGYEQFFTNSSYEFAPMIVSALQQIRANETSEITARALSALGAKSDWLPEQYEAAALDANESVRDELNLIDETYYKVSEPIANLLFEFIKANRSDISF